MTTTAPYGSWKSPVSADLVATAGVGLGQVALDGDDIFWVEMRPSEGGRMVIVRQGPGGGPNDITLPPFSVRTRVHEYGGGAFLVNDGVVYFSNFADQRMYRQEPGVQPEAITPEVALRYADGVYDQRRERIICVREDHSGKGEPVNAIVAVGARGDRPQLVLFGGSDFCSTPRLSPDGGTLAWLAWDHPNMPWDGTRLLIAPVLDNGALGEPAQVAGGEAESVFQPSWSPEGELYFVSDRSGWWNLYRVRDGQVEALTNLEVEFGKPQWALGAATYGFPEAGRIACSYVDRGTWRLALLDTETREFSEIETGFSEMYRGDLQAVGGRVAYVAGSPTQPMTLVLLDVASGRRQTLRRSNSLELDPGYLSTPEPVEFSTGDGNTAHAFYYPPKNQDFGALEGERPPLLVKSHGGPTGAASTALDLSIQFWTSRGVGVLDVNYGGSTGYGTEYRRRLNGAWGVVDVDDCANAALYLVERGDADPERLAIAGGSAGGYTTLAALTFRDVFKAGASHYGVSDLETLAQETHKFESRYLDSLVGSYPERQDLYRERSPINFTDRLSCPLVLLQGLEDAIVPPNQAEMMFESVRTKGLPTAYVSFEGEQHGFRQAANIRRALEVELYFYSRVFGFELAEPVEPVRIENLD